nr:MULTISPECIES: hypothetical protein [unclassified Streptomyces]
MVPEAGPYVDGELVREAAEDLVPVPGVRQDAGGHRIMAHDEVGQFFGICDPSGELGTQQVVAPGTNPVGEPSPEDEIRVSLVLPQVVGLPEHVVVDLQPDTQDEFRRVRQPNRQQAPDEGADTVNPEQRGGTEPVPGLLGRGEGGVGQLETDVDAPLVRKGVAAAGTGRQVAGHAISLGNGRTVPSPGCPGGGHSYLSGRP